MKYGFIGCGNMGGAIATALSRSTKDILLASKSKITAQTLAGKLGCQASDNETVIMTCDVVFLGVKPQMMQDVLSPLLPLLQKHKPLLVSMAAGLTLNRLSDFAGGNIPIVRIMPNTPISIGRGMTTYCTNALVKNAVLEKLLEDISPAGRFDLIEEQHMDAATVAAGCAPAYVYMFIDAIAEGASACGLPPKEALEFAATATSGAAQLLLESNADPKALCDAVCSPGGSTIAGVRSLEESNFHSIVVKAIEAAYKRNVELGK